MADLFTFILCFAILCVVGCAMTRKTPRAMEAKQHELHQQHLHEVKQWRDDGRMPPTNQLKAFPKPPRKK